jgi:hypothetical protein
LVASKREVIAVHLIPNNPIVVHRWAVWQPWAVTGGGAALVGVGVLLEVAARHNYDAYDHYVHTMCPPTGCPASNPYLDDHHSRARLENGFGTTTIIVGSAAISAGLALVIMNRAHIQMKEAPVIAPIPTGAGATVNVSGRF